MVDLNDAGTRLAAFRAGPIPDVADIRARSARWARTRRRRRAGVAGTFAIVVVAAVLTVVSHRSHTSQQITVGPHPTTPATFVPSTTLRPRVAPAGSRPVDIGQLRLWLPPDWHVVSSPTGSSTRCWSPPARSVYVPVPSAIARPVCLSGATASDATSPGPRLRVVPLRDFRPGSLVRSTIHGVAVWMPSPRIAVPAGVPTVIDVPSLGVRLIGSAGSAAVADSLRASGPHIVLAAHYPVSIPAGWKTVRFDGFAAEVPASWPTERVRVIRTRDSVSVRNAIGVCGEDPFYRADRATLGQYEGYMCPYIDAGLQVGEDTSPADGLWLQEVTTPGWQVVAGRQEQLADGALRLGAGEAGIAVMDTVTFQLTVGRHSLIGVVGLGVDPSVAEEIISSLRLGPTPP